MNIQRLSILTVLLPVTLFGASSSSLTPASPVSAQPEIIKACSVFAYVPVKTASIPCLYTIILVNTGQVLVYRRIIEINQKIDSSTGTPVTTGDQNKFIGKLNRGGIFFDDVIDIEVAASNFKEYVTHAIRIMTTHRDKKIRIALWKPSQVGHDTEVMTLELPK